MDNFVNIFQITYPPAPRMTQIFRNSLPKGIPHFKVHFEEDHAGSLHKS